GKLLLCPSRRLCGRFCVLRRLCLGARFGFSVSLCFRFRCLPIALGLRGQSSQSLLFRLPLRLEGCGLLALDIVELVESNFTAQSLLLQYVGLQALDAPAFALV